MTKEMQRQLGDAVFLVGVVLMMAWLVFILPFIGAMAGWHSVGAFYGALGQAGILAYGQIHLGHEVSNLYFIAALLSVVVGKLAMVLVQTGMNLKDEVRPPKLAKPLADTPSSRHPSPFPRLTS